MREKFCPAWKCGSEDQLRVGVKHLLKRGLNYTQNVQQWDPSLLLRLLGAQRAGCHQIGQGCVLGKLTRTIPSSKKHRLNRQKRERNTTERDSAVKKIVLKYLIIHILSKKSYYTHE